MSKWANNTIIIVACPERDAGNDPEALALTFHQGPTFINEYCLAATNVVDWDSGGGNDMPWLRSALSECFI